MFELTIEECQLKWLVYFSNKFSFPVRLNRHRKSGGGNNHSKSGNNLHESLLKRLLSYRGKYENSAKNKKI